MTIPSFTDHFTKLNFPLMGLVRLPEVVVPDSVREKLGIKRAASNKDVLKHLCYQGYLSKRAAGKFEGIGEATVIARLKEEFEVFTKTGIVDYLLLVWDILQWCDDHDIPRGPGRGSVAGSLSAYCCGITKVNPLKHFLNFTRFISEARAKPQIIDGVIYAAGKSLCDIDCDVSYSQRDKVISYIEKKYPGRVAKIANRLELTGKTALKDILKIYLDYPEEDARRISNHVESIHGAMESLSKALKDRQQLKNWLIAEPINKEAVDLALAIEGVTNAKGVHASGIYISYAPLEGNMPTELSRTNELITSYDMNIVAELGVKLDCLALKTLDLIWDTCSLVGIKMDDIDINHPSIYKYLSSTDRYYGLFQIESGLTKDITKRVAPRHIDDLMACLAISRPGALAGIDAFIKYVRTGERKKIYPPIDDLLPTTGGLILYQESINEICQHVYGMSATDADEVRRAIGKKLPEDMAKWEPVLYARGKELGIPNDVTKYFWDTCNASASYLFSLNHTAPYSYITAQTAYLKANYPKEFFLSLFRMSRHEADSLDCISSIMNEAIAMGINVLPPDLIKSSYDFDLDRDGNIRFGLSHIKGISDSTMQKLTAFKRDFKTRFDIFEAASAAKINIGVLTSLIYAGCVDSKGEPRPLLALHAQLYNLLTDREKPIIHRLASEYHENLIAILKALPEKKDEKGKPLIRESRLETIRRDYKGYLEMYRRNIENEELTSYMYERHLLGFSYSNTLHKVYSKRIPNLKSLGEVLILADKAKAEATRIAALSDEERAKLEKPVQGDPIQMVAFVKEAKSHISKSSNKPYFKLIVFDDSDTLRAMLFGEEKVEHHRQYNGRLAQEGDLVIINGFISRDGGMFFADTILIQQEPVAFKKVAIEEGNKT